MNWLRFFLGILLLGDLAETSYAIDPVIEKASLALSECAKRTGCSLELNQHLKHILGDDYNVHDLMNAVDNENLHYRNMEEVERIQRQTQVRLELLLNDPIFNKLDPSLASLRQMLEGSQVETLRLKEQETALVYSMIETLINRQPEQGYDLQAKHLAAKFNGNLLKSVGWLREEKKIMSDPSVRFGFYPDILEASKSQPQVRQVMVEIMLSVAWCNGPFGRPKDYFLFHDQQSLVTIKAQILESTRRQNSIRIAVDMGTQLESLRQDHATWSALAEQSVRDLNQHLIKLEQRLGEDPSRKSQFLSLSHLLIKMATCRSFLALVAKS